ncbi:hypothetical protein [Paenibacillus sp. FSL M7-0420]|uniref:hypothetical protein n=1 Tax=Paenibacillus sp. FSL M7-0420 TaxID=2921609 RepID=UPI0030F5A3F3
MKATVTLTKNEDEAQFVRIMSNPQNDAVTVGKMYPIKRSKVVNASLPDGGEPYIIDDNSNENVGVFWTCKMSFYAL